MVAAEGHPSSSRSGSGDQAGEPDEENNAPVAVKTLKSRFECLATSSTSTAPSTTPSTSTSTSTAPSTAPSTAAANLISTPNSNSNHINLPPTQPRQPTNPNLDPLTASTRPPPPMVRPSFNQRPGPVPGPHRLSCHQMLLSEPLSPRSCSPACPSRLVPVPPSLQPPVFGPDHPPAGFVCDQNPQDERPFQHRHPPPTASPRTPSRQSRPHLSSSPEPPFVPRSASPALNPLPVCRSPPPAIPPRPSLPLINMPVPHPTGSPARTAPDLPRSPARKSLQPSPSRVHHHPDQHLPAPYPRRISLSLSPSPHRTILGPPPPPPPRPRPRSRSNTVSPANRPRAPPPAPPKPHRPPLPPPIRPRDLPEPSHGLPGVPPPLPERAPAPPVGPREWAPPPHTAPEVTGAHMAVTGLPGGRQPASLPAAPLPFSPGPQKKWQPMTPRLGVGLPPDGGLRAGWGDDSDDDEEGEPEAPATAHAPPPPLSRAFSGSWTESPLGARPYGAGRTGEACRVEDMPDATFANRRPPTLTRHIVLNIGAQFSACALRGAWLCTGHHHFKLWNAATGECTSQLNSMQDTKIVSMEFKGGGRARMGREVWCGTKDGQVFEYDCGERRIVDSKSSLHSGAVVGLFRYKDGGMCSLDESGKVQIWAGPARVSGPTRAQRVADKTNFAAMLAHRLWTATGPSGSKSAPVPAQRAPTIRVYDPDPAQPWTLTPRPATIPDAASAGVVVGQVVAGAVVPARPQLVYLGHESGHVSVWETHLGPLPPSDPPSTPGDLPRRPSMHVPASGAPGTAAAAGPVRFRKLIKLSNYQITAMEGVSKYLWVGLRTGYVFVYEPEVEPHPEDRRGDGGPSAGDGGMAGPGGSWKVLKVWKAHKESICRIMVDPSVLWDESPELHVATTSSDWKVKVWDGTMSVDWMSAEMKKRQSEYCTYRPIKALVCSWNVDACRPNELVGTCDNLNFLEDVLRSSLTGSDSGSGPGPGEAPDVIVFGFQEMIDLENKKLTAKTVLLGGRKKGAEKLSDSVSQAYRKWHDRLVAAVRLAMPPEDPYVVIHTENLVGLFTCVFVKSSERAKMRDIAVTTVKTGMKGRYGNKGAIAARFVIDDSSICFINCHLAAGQKHIRQRNADLIDILEEKADFPDPPEVELNGVYVGGGNGSAIADHEICFIQGDLNYRIDARREDVIRAIAAGEYWKMLEYDQLTKERKMNPSFRLRSFYEPPIRFHPTYKYDPGTHMYDSSEKNRVPAWCDRILYRTPLESSAIAGRGGHEVRTETQPSSLGSGGRGVGQAANGREGRLMVEAMNYRRYEVNVSDHRPISGTYRIWVKSIVLGLRRGVWAEVKGRWRVVEEEVMRAARGYYEGLE